MALTSLGSPKRSGPIFLQIKSASARAACCVLVVIAVAVSGCQKHPFEVAPVSGKITIDGQPLTAGKVMFAPTAKGGNHEAGRTAMGRLQADGSFQLTTYDEGDGAVVGEHWVTIFGSGDKAAAGTPATPRFARLVVPEKKTVLPGQDNQIDIQLTRQDVARLGTKD